MWTWIVGASVIASLAAFLLGVWPEISETKPDIEPPMDSAAVLPWHLLWTMTNQSWLFAMKDAEVRCDVSNAKGRGAITTFGGYMDLGTIAPGDTTMIPCTLDDPWYVVVLDDTPPGIRVLNPPELRFDVTVHYRVGVWPFLVGRKSTKSRLWVTVSDDGSHHWTPLR